MNSSPHYLILKILRKAYQSFYSDSNAEKPSYVEKDFDKASEMIYQQLIRDEPCMIARFGAFERSTIVNYLGIANPKHSGWGYIKGKQPQWWWEEKLIYYMNNNAGFFPATTENLSKFSEMMLNDVQELDILGSWLKDEDLILNANKIKPVKKVKLLCLEPYWSKNPWSRQLEGKHILVIHPFSEDIISQYTYHREQLFEDKRVLPKFASLRVVKAVQSIGGVTNGFDDWFDALESMKHEMDSAPYDIALIGCGAYGFPLAAHAKRTGHKAVHLGGALQLLFGIKGKRWEAPNYGIVSFGREGVYADLFNSNWISPSKQYKPINGDSVESGCYW